MNHVAWLRSMGGELMIRLASQLALTLKSTKWPLYFFSREYVVYRLYKPTLVVIIIPKFFLETSFPV